MKPQVKMIQTAQDELQTNSLNQTLAFQSHYNISQGSTNFQRVGNEIKATAHHIKGIMHNNAANNQYVRMLVLGCPVGVDTATTDYIFKPNQTGLSESLSTVYGLNAMYTSINTDIFKVYHDRVFKLGPVTDPTGTCMFSKFIKLGGKRIKFAGNSNGIMSSGTGQDWQLLTIFITSEANDDTTTGAIVELSYIARSWFSDV